MPKTGQSAYDRGRQVTYKLRAAGVLEKYPPSDTELYTATTMYDSGPKGVAARQRERVANGDKLPERGYIAKEHINKMREEDRRNAMVKAIRGG